MSDPELFCHCWFITGPTASGKTDVGVALAERIHAEIVVADSMTVYKGMEIGTAKATRAHQEAVPHHLLDLVSPTEEFSVSQFLAAATDAVTDIKQRGKEALFVGGTPLYLRALLRGMDDGPPPDPEFRRQVEDELQQVGNQALHDRLNLVDPLSAARIHPHDTKRMIRALEVFHATGTQISHRQRHFDQPPAILSKRAFVLNFPRPVLHDRINARVESMFERGFVDEVQELLNQYGALGKTAAQAVGYKEVIEHLSGNATLKETINLVQARTRQFARRQETWFRSFDELRCVSAGVMSGPDIAQTMDDMSATGSES